MTDVNKLNEHIAGLRTEQVTQQFYFWKHCLELNRQKELDAGFLVGLYETRLGIWHEIIPRVLSDRHDFHANDLYQGVGARHLPEEYSAARIAQNLWGLWAAAAPLEDDAAEAKVEEFVAACLLVWTSDNAWATLKSWAQGASTTFHISFSGDLAKDLWVESTNFGCRPLPKQWPGDGEFTKPTEISFWLALHAVEVAYEQIDNIREGTRTLGAFILPPARENHMPGVATGLGKLWRHMAACAPAWGKLLKLLFAFEFRPRDAARPLAAIEAAHGQDQFIALAGTRHVGKTTLVETLHRMGKGTLVRVDDVSGSPSIGPGTQVSFVTELQAPEHGNPRLRCADVAGEDLIDAAGNPPLTLGNALKNRPPAAFLIVLDPNDATQQQRQALAQVNQWQLNNSVAGMFSIPIVILINKIDQWKAGKQQWIDFAKNKAANAEERALAPEFFGGSFARMDVDEALSKQPAYRDVMNEAVTLFGPELEKLLVNNQHARVYFSVATDDDCYSLQEAWNYLAGAVIECSRSKRAAWKAGQITQLKQQVRYFKLLDGLGCYLSSPDPTTSLLAGTAGAGLAHAIGWLLHGLSDLETAPVPDKPWVAKCQQRLLELIRPPSSGFDDAKWNIDSLLGHLLEDLGIKHLIDEASNKKNHHKVPDTNGSVGQFTSQGGEINEGDAWKPITGCSRTRCAFVDNGMMFAATDIPVEWPAGSPTKSLLTNDFANVGSLKSRIGYLVNQRSTENYQKLRVPQFALQKGSTDLPRINSLKTVFPQDPRAGWIAELMVRMRVWADPQNGLRASRLIAAECFISLGAMAHKRGAMMRAVSCLIPGTADHGLCTLGLNDAEWLHLAAPATDSKHPKNRYLFGMELKRYSARMCRHLARVEAEYYKRTKWLQPGDVCEPPGRSHFPDIEIDAPIEDGLESLEEGFNQGGIQRPGLIDLLEKKLDA